MSFRMISGIPVFLCVCVSPLFAQTENDPTAEVIIESAAENAAEDLDYSSLEENLINYQKHPLDLNEATKDQLAEFLFLTPIQINNLLKYRTENGRLIALQELQAVDSFDPATIEKLLPYVTAGQIYTPDFKDPHHKNDQNLIITYGQLIQKQRGYLISDTAGRSYYEGSPQHILVRYRAHPARDVSAAFTMEKDPGEAFLSGSEKQGFDFYSGNIFYKNSGRIRKLILGDYSLQFGQGLSMWSGLSFAKGASLAAAVKQQDGLKPYTSANESMFLRGIAASIAFKHFELTPFASMHKADATLSQTDTSGSSVGITTLGQSGLHRTPAEISRHNSVSQSVYGANIRYEVNSFRAGAILYHTSFSKSFIAGKHLYDKYDFTGSDLNNAGLYYNYNWQNMYFFGEASHSLNSGFAMLNGTMASLSKQVSVVLLYRNYQKNYYSFYNQGMAEGSNGTAEKGLYTGIVINPDSKTELSAYADVFRFPWLKYGVDAPSHGYEIQCRFSYSANKKMQLIVRYRLKFKQENDDSTATVHFPEDVQNQNFRLELDYKAGPFQFRNRAELSLYKKEAAHEQGVLLYQDILYKPMRSRFSGNLRFALFDTDGFNSRIYAFENDVLYSYSIPAYQNCGTRFYVNAKYKFKRSADLSVRYAISSYANQEETGSGTDLIEGHNRSEIKIQLAFQF